jgi:hypothetical protein
MDIFEAIGENDIKRIEELLNEGVDVNIKQEENVLTPLIIASRDSTKDVIEFLLKRGADVNMKAKGGYTALMTASRTRSKDIIELLLNYGSDVNTRDVSQWTPLILATVYNSNPDIINLLLDRGADINAKTNNGVNALIAVIKTRPEDIDIIRLLLEHGANPLEKYNNYDLIESCQDDICKKLISEYIWKKLYKRDIETAQKYSRSTILPKDVWTLILLNKRQQMLCSKLSSSKNKEVLEFFAVELEIPITKEMTKGQLCGLISRQLAYGKGYKNVTQEIKTYKNQILTLAKKFNIDINQPMNSILKDLGDIF